MCYKLHYIFQNLAFSKTLSKTSYNILTLKANIEFAVIKRFSRFKMSPYKKFIEVHVGIYKDAFSFY